MKNKNLKTLTLLCLSTIMSCSQNNNSIEKKEEVKQKTETSKKEPHRYGGWYCPDNLNGFPAVDIKEWNNVPVVNGRLATKEETQNGISLIFVDLEKYPKTKPLDINMPKLAKYFNSYTNKEDLVIVIQALNIDNDSVVGFRFLNGGNGSAHLSEVSFLSEKEIERIPSTRFVSQNVEIKATQVKIWEVLTNLESLDALQTTFDNENKLKKEWRKLSNVNFHYLKSGNPTSSYADMLYGCYYIQNDYEYTQYVEKFLLLENNDTKETELKIVCGPFGNDYDDQKEIINNWAKKVKKLSEQK